MLSVTDSWVKWLWQDTEAWRIRFRVAPKSVPVPICQLKNRSSDNPSQLTHSQPYKGLPGRGKAQSNTNKHEDQQMALSVIVFFSLFFKNPTAQGPCSLSFLTYPYKSMYCLIACIFPSNSFFFPPWFPLSIPFVPGWFSSKCDMQLSQVFSSPPHSCHQSHSMLFHSNYNWRCHEWKRSPWFHNWEILIASHVLAKVRCMWVESENFTKEKEGREVYMKIVANLMFHSQQYSWACFRELYCAAFLFTVPYYRSQNIISYTLAMLYKVKSRTLLLCSNSFNFESKIMLKRDTNVLGNEKKKMWQFNLVEWTL